MRKIAVLGLVAATLPLLSCDDQIGPTETSPAGPSWVIQDADHNKGNPFARWLPPIVEDVAEESFGTFDPTITSARLHVVCIATNDPAPVHGGHGCHEDAAHWRNPANAVDSYEVPDGTFLIQEDQYHAQVELADLSQSDKDTWTIYRMVVTVQPSAAFGELVVAIADIRALTNGRAISSLSEEEIGLVGSKLPAKIRLDEGVVAQAIADAFATDPGKVPVRVAKAVASFGTGDFKITVIKAGEPTTATYEEEGVTKAAFVFDGDELADVDDDGTPDDIAFVLGEPRETGETGEEIDVCGEDVPFEKSGCKRAHAVALTTAGDPEPEGSSEVTSGYFFANKVEFCIATDIPEDQWPLPWKLIKIDRRGEEAQAEYEVLPYFSSGGACDLVSEGPAPSSGAIGWLQRNVGKRFLDLLASPLYADHSVTRMGSSIGDLSDLTAALLTDLELASADGGPSSGDEVSTDEPVLMVARVAYQDQVDPADPEHVHSGGPAEGVNVVFSIPAGAGSLSLPAEAPGTVLSDTEVSVPTDLAGEAYVLWTVATDGPHTLEASIGDPQADPATFNLTGLAAGPDLVIASITPPAPVESGTVMTLDWSYRNAGPGPVPDCEIECATVAVEFFLSADAALDDGDLSLGRGAFQPWGLAADSDPVSSSTALSIPTGTAVGDYHLLVVLDPVDQVAEVDETNNTGSVPLQVGLPDLMIQGIIQPEPDPAAPGGFIDFHFTVRNDGAAPVPACDDPDGCTGLEIAAIYISSDDVLSEDDVLEGRIQTTQVFGMVPGAFLTSTSRLTIDAAQADGLYYLIIVTDEPDAVRESDETNNTGFQSFFVNSETIFAMHGGTLSRINPVNGRVSPVGSGDAAIAGVTLHPIQNTLLAAQGADGTTTAIYDVDVCNGTQTLLASGEGLPNGLQSLAIDPTGETLYILGTSLSILQGGVLTHVGSLQDAEGSPYVAYGSEVDVEGTLYAVYQDLFIVDEESAEVTVVGPLLLPGGQSLLEADEFAGSLTFDGSGNAYVGVSPRGFPEGSDATLYQLDLATGQLSRGVVTGPTHRMVAMSYSPNPTCMK